MGILKGVHLTVKRGARLKRTFQLTDKKGTPIPLTFYVARMQVRDKPTGSTVLADLDETGTLDALTTVTAATGKVDIFIGGDVTSGYTFAHGTFDIRMVKYEMLRLSWVYDLGLIENLCTMKASKDYCAIPKTSKEFKMPKLQELYKKLFGNPFDNAHNALADIQATAKCYWRLKELGEIR